MLLGTGSACPTRWTSAPCTSDQRRGDQRVPMRHTTIMPHLPRWLHPMLELANPELAGRDTMQCIGLCLRTTTARRALQGM